MDASTFSLPVEFLEQIRLIFGEKHCGIDPAGKNIKTGFYTSKGVVGCDFTRLLTGAEETLDVITEATLKLLPLPKYKYAFQVLFDSVEVAIQMVLYLCLNLIYHMPLNLWMKFF